MIVTPRQALDAAIKVMGAIRAHALLGCDWGRGIWLPDDKTPCTEPAHRRTILHDHHGGTLTVKLCKAHEAILNAATDPHD